MTDTHASRHKDRPPPLRLSEITTDNVAGLVCRRCGCRHFETVYTRPKLGCILRLRQCRHCGYRMVTRERA
jgi:ribosomal protein L40E